MKSESKYSLGSAVDTGKKDAELLYASVRMVGGCGIASAGLTETRYALYGLIAG